MGISGYHSGAYLTYNPFGYLFPQGDGSHVNWAHDGFSPPLQTQGWSRYLILPAGRQINLALLGRKQLRHAGGQLLDLGFKLPLAAQGLLVGQGLLANRRGLCTFTHVVFVYRMWSHGWELNPHKPVYKTGALPV